ncbi:ABC transporter permease [Paenibacillus campinasensis]|uniref:ABC transporter permease n=1 Tax=Paenibacillus campinasensis TaxID=66347 RepID=A0A268EJX5_9BACL|nr:iron ABC transporter permease [Paenibacillus campinasensis]MUG67319.1 ABC transporter permease subunit [Paenibacillus campinasensis]PAD73428.1 ABC transporter permease [Paenibacillus campinasensis]
MKPVFKDSPSFFRNIGIILALFLLVIGIVIPLLLIFWQSVSTGQGLDLLAPIRTIAGHDLSSVLFQTIWLGVCVVAGTTLLALPLAWIMSKTRLGQHRWIDVVLMIPFMTPPYIGSMGWILFMQKGGYLQQWLPGSAALSDSFFSFGGMVLIMCLHLFPFLYLLLRDAIIRIGGNLEEAGAVHGASSGYRFRRIMLPLLLSSYGMGAMLVFVKTIAEFGTPATFGRRIGYYVMTSEIHKYISSWPIDFGKATSLASILLSVCLVMWYMQSTISRRFTYRLVGGKGQRSKRYALRGLTGAASVVYLALLLIFSIGIPYFSVIVASLMKLRGAGLAWDNLTLDHYRDLLTWGSVSMKALGNSLGLSLAASTIAVVLGTGFALAVGKSQKRTQRVIDLFSLLPNTVPGIVMVVGLILFWNSPWLPATLYNTYGMVVLTYVVLFLPYTVQYVKANFTQIDGSLFQAGQVFGGGPLLIMRRILLPLIVPGMLAGWIMTFTISVRELVGSLLILPPSMQTSATYIFAQFEQGQVSLGMAMAVVSVGMTVALLLVVEALKSNRKWNAS